MKSFSLLVKQHFQISATNREEIAEFARPHEAFL
jgi:hypothetical protein